jgi:hypothetical protein
MYQEEGRMENELVAVTEEELVNKLKEFQLEIWKKELELIKYHFQLKHKDEMIELLEKHLDVMTTRLDNMTELNEILKRNEKQDKEHILKLKEQNDALIEMSKHK